MGRELQKKKNRSSIPKVRQKPKSKKLYNPRSNAIIAANWDHSLSVAQNYRNLGLTSRINQRTGGVEKYHRIYASDKDAVADTDDLLAIGGKKASKLQIQEVEVVRDPETGKIISVVSDGTEKKRVNPLGDLLNDVEEDYDEKLITSAQVPRKQVVRDLEDLAARGEEKRPRKQSQREKEWIGKLVKKHGYNYKAMSRDARLNTMQQSEGDIKARVQQWKNAKGDDSSEKMDVVDEYVPGSHSHEHHTEHEVNDDTKPRCSCTQTWEEFKLSRKTPAQPS